MEIKWYPCDLGDLSWVALYVLSDLHYGNPYSDIKRWNHNLEYVAQQPNSFVILNGDLCESSLRTSKGDIYKQVGSPQDQRDQVIEWLKPVKKKILGMTTGNHEQRIWKEAGIDISEDIAKGVGVTNYDPEGIWLNLKFSTGANRVTGRPYSYWVYTTHGYGGARTKGGKAVKAERLATHIRADIYGMSHDHEVNVAPLVRLDPNPKTYEKNGQRYGHAEAHRMELVKTNAYLKWGGYARSGGFSPPDLSTPAILLRGEDIPWVGPHYNSALCKPEVKVQS